MPFFEQSELRGLDYLCCRLVSECANAREDVLTAIAATKSSKAGVTARGIYECCKAGGFEGQEVEGRKGTVESLKAEMLAGKRREICTWVEMTGRLNRGVLDVKGRLDVGGAVTVEAGGGDGLGEDDADGDEDGASTGSEGNGDFDAGAFGILIAAAEAKATFGQIFADGDFFLKAAVANAGEDAGFDAGAVAARNHAFFDGGAVSAIFRVSDFGLGFDPDGRGVAKLADARDALADFEGFQLQLVKIDDFAALAKAAFHEESSEGFFAFVRSWEVDVPEVGARIENMNGVKEVIGRVLVDFGDYAGAGALPVIAFEIAAQVELLAHGEFLGQAEDAAIAADEQGFGVLREGDAGGREPRCLDRHAEPHAVTLPESIG